MEERDNIEQLDGGIQFTGFDDKKSADMPNIIKVIGVGGGGGNAVNHMYREGIHGVTYVVCNTDSKALGDSPVPNKLQLGKDGLGAGNRPERAKEVTIECKEDIKEMLGDGTRMVFITAGMGGGTGTGAAPIIAQCAKDLGILTVGIVTIPFRFEGDKKIRQALDGVEEMSKHVDAMLVINNERLRKIYQEFSIKTAFAKADDTLTVAARSIADIITMHGIINLDFQDVTTVLKDGGVAVMSTGYAEGENRVTKAIEEALHSPLLNNNDIYKSSKILININFADKDENAEMKMEEMNEIHEFMSKFDLEDVETKMGLAIDPELGNKVKITLLATGFGLKNVPGMKHRIEERDGRIPEWYDDEGGEIRKKVQIFKFRPEDMDNDEIISKVETTPTHKRTREELKQINAITPAAPKEKETAKPTEENGETVSNENEVVL